MKRAVVSLRSVVLFTVLALVSTALFTELVLVKSSIAAELGLPGPTQMLGLSGIYKEARFQGIKIDPDNPLLLEFLVSSGDNEDIAQEDLMRMVNYFLAGLTTPKDKLWVNLSPYEANRVIDTDVEHTDIGRDMLAQDYILKQLSSSITHPDTKLGLEYWKSIEGRTQDAFNKIWISPNKAEVYEDEKTNVILITEASLKLETEFDYLAKKKNGISSKTENNSPISKILPTLENDVNSGKNFSKLRQIYHSLILAQTFKTKFSNSLYRHYINKGNINGIAIDDKTAKDKLYKLYCQAFEKGVYDIVRKDNTDKRRYFSGGIQNRSLAPVQSGDKTRARKMASAITEILKVDLSMSSSVKLDDLAKLQALKERLEEKPYKKALLEQMSKRLTALSINQKDWFVELDLIASTDSSPSYKISHHDKFNRLKITVPSTAFDTKEELEHYLADYFKNFSDKEIPNDIGQMLAKRIGNFAQVHTVKAIPTEYRKLTELTVPKDKLPSKEETLSSSKALQAEEKRLLVHMINEQLSEIEIVDENGDTKTYWFKLSHDWKKNVYDVYDMVKDTHTNDNIVTVYINLDAFNTEEQIKSAVMDYFQRISKDLDCTDDQNIEMIKQQSVFWSQDDKKEFLTYLNDNLSEVEALTPKKNIETFWFQFSDEWRKGSQNIYNQRIRLVKDNIMVKIFVNLDAFDTQVELRSALIGYKRKFGYNGSVLFGRTENLELLTMIDGKDLGLAHRKTQIQQTSGGIDLMDIDVSGISSALFEGYELSNPMAFETMVPKILSFSSIDNTKRLLSND